MLLIKNGRVVDPKSGFDQVADVLVDGKKVVKIADAIEEAGAEVIDATGLVVAPGLVDIHVHFREPVSSPFYLTTLWLSLNKVVDWGEQESHPTIVTRQLQLTTCFFSLESINQFQELIKEIASIVWTRCCIWVELH